MSLLLLYRPTRTVAPIPPTPPALIGGGGPIAGPIHYRTLRLTGTEVAATEEHGSLNAVLESHGIETVGTQVAGLLSNLIVQRGSTATSHESSLEVRRLPDSEVFAILDRIDKRDRMS